MRIRNTICVAVLAALLGSTGAFAQDHRDDQDHHEDQDRHNDQDRHQDQNRRGDDARQQDRDHHDNHAYVRHEEWRKGQRMRSEDWNRGERIDYRSHHLKAPPRGYEWREVDGNYILAAAATGLIASVIAASSAH